MMNRIGIQIRRGYIKILFNYHNNYMITEFHSNPKNIIVFVGAFAKDGIIYDKYPSFALKINKIKK